MVSAAMATHRHDIVRREIRERHIGTRLGDGIGGAAKRLSNRGHGRREWAAYAKALSPHRIARAVALAVNTFGQRGMAERVGFGLARDAQSAVRHDAQAGSRRQLSEAKLAERVGFEPTVEFPLHTLSKRA